MKHYNVVDHHDFRKDVLRLNSSNLSRWDLSSRVIEAEDLLRVMDFYLTHETDKDLMHYLIKSYFKNYHLTEFNHGKDNSK